ncbi:TetR/AcrR family transcriptional regulator [Bremerella cremea]|uniref:TetR/AcrR family transcriptional regulator n=1 Tax=Bremerella cremea TaxID=1031537 RepID=UPI0031E982EA
MQDTKPKSKARERIVDTALRLFYSDGINSVGIDRIIAEADVAKMTLYNHFKSKDDLILAVLQRRDAIFFQFFDEQIEKGASKKGGRLGGFFTALKKWFSAPEFRGCMFINTAAEIADCNHPAFQYSVDHKKRFNDLLADAIKASAPDAPAQVVPAIELIVEGSIVTAVMQHSPKPADQARKATRQLLGETWLDE